MWLEKENDLVAERTFDISGGKSKVQAKVIAVSADFSLLAILCPETSIDLKVRSLFYC
mgnify:CR=1 FL=1